MRYHRAAVGSHGSRLALRLAGMTGWRGCPRVALLFNKLAALIPLKIEQSSRPRIVEPDRDRLLDLGLAAEGDAEAGLLQHRDVVGAVADRQCCRQRDTALLR